jgi:hypothetical protein
MELLVAILIPVLLASASTAYLTSLLCRFARWRQWRIGWHLSFFGAVATFGLGVLTIMIAGYMQPGNWGEPKVGIFRFLMGLLAIASVISSVAGFLVVASHLRRVSHRDRMA